MRPRRWALLLVALPACGAPSAPRPIPFVLPAAVAAAPSSPGPFPRHRAFDAALVNARCEACHREIAAEWRASFHRASHVDPVYRRQLAHEPRSFCNGCHAPETTSTELVPEPLGAIGVGCVTCHVVGDRILAAPRREGTAADGAHHAIVRTAALDEAACAACHEFAFPDSRADGGRSPLTMQSTLSEHAASKYADRSCAACHMPWVPDAGRGHRSHAFAASRDEASVRGAVVIEDGGLVGDELRLTLRPGVVGHAFPTGDLLRRLALRVEVLDAEGQWRLRAERFLMRRFGFERGSPYQAPRRVLAGDDRVGASGEPIEIRQPVSGLAPGARVRWTLRYERVADPAPATRTGAVVEGAITIAQRIVTR